MGKWCHWLAVISQMASFLLVPCAFLVLGGTLLDGLFEIAYNTTYWIMVVMYGMGVHPSPPSPDIKISQLRAYSPRGCQITDNLLYSIYPDSNGLTTLGFRSDWGAVVMAYFFMQLHITIIFSVKWQSLKFVF
ncbi:Amino Acid/Auxin Permease [Phytophthora megakarya]|uniref:Amino Acid/Auxin Permease n=1 Tax=Phytophthora megakarya TaxID=4795 RepID=A0A225WY44_9STRA|nr:Amino Acid/Auxin Permease [Phytophthora megakarya]